MGHWSPCCCTRASQTVVRRAVCRLCTGRTDLCSLCSGRGVQHGSGSHPHDHVLIAPTLHSSVGEDCFLSRGRMCIVRPLRSNRGSGSGCAHRYRRSCSRSGIAVVGSSINGGDATTPSHRDSWNPATTSGEKSQASRRRIVGSSQGSWRRKVVDLEIRCNSSHGTGLSAGVYRRAMRSSLTGIPGLLEYLWVNLGRRRGVKGSRRPAQ